MTARGRKHSSPWLLARVIFFSFGLRLLKLFSFSIGWFRRRSSALLYLQLRLVSHANCQEERGRQDSSDKHHRFIVSSLVNSMFLARNDIINHTFLVLRGNINNSLDIWHLFQRQTKWPWMTCLHCRISRGYVTR